MAVYRAHTGNFNLFLNIQDGIINTLYKADLKLTIRGDVNIDYLTMIRDNLMQCFSLTMYQLQYISPLYLMVIPVLQYILYTGC